ncbi:hypoxia up-regulated protein [Musa troglodytarum]|uniref:Hypoxia up-regulated protein n=1 Tax=Musa troglodytarum TaxID=320322 RepID=A0A9E7K929_9LILI|nr:hypoxia up-regulated protein [Musa troglodytarum]
MRKPCSGNYFEGQRTSLRTIEDNNEVAKISSEEVRHSFVEKLTEIINNWETNKPWLPKTRIEEVLSEAEKLKIWLVEVEELQKKASLFSTPFSTSDEVYQKVSKLQDKVASVNRIPKPKPKPEKPPKEEPANQDNSTSTSNSTSGEQTSETGHARQDSSSTTDQENVDHEEL